MDTPQSKFASSLPSIHLPRVLLPNLSSLTSLCFSLSLSLSLLSFTHSLTHARTHSRTHTHTRTHHAHSVSHYLSQSICLSICLFIYPFIYLPIYLASSVSLARFTPSNERVSLFIFYSLSLSLSLSLSSLVSISSQPIRETPFSSREETRPSSLVRSCTSIETSFEDFEPFLGGKVRLWGYP